MPATSPAAAASTMARSMLPLMECVVWVQEGGKRKPAAPLPDATPPLGWWLTCHVCVCVVLHQCIIIIIIILMANTAGDRHTSGMGALWRAITEPPPPLGEPDDAVPPVHPVFEPLIMALRCEVAQGALEVLHTLV